MKPLLRVSGGYLQLLLRSLQYTLQTLSCSRLDYNSLSLVAWEWDKRSSKYPYLTQLAISFICEGPQESKYIVSKYGNSNSVKQS